MRFLLYVKGYIFFVVICFLLFIVETFMVGVKFYSRIKIRSLDDGLGVGLVSRVFEFKIDVINFLFKVIGEF